MEMDRSHLTTGILQLTLEIIYLLTGEDYGPIKKSAEPRPWTLKNVNNKILQVTKKITELLTGEVPIRCQDVTVYFSMEEWEYLEGHKDLYKDVVMEDQQIITSPVLSLVGSNQQSSKCMEKNNGIVINSLTAKCSSPEEQNTRTSCEERVPCSDISTSTDIVQDLSLPITEEKLSCKEHLHDFLISSPTHCAQSSSKEEDFKAKEHLPISDTFTPFHETQSLSKKEDLNAAEHLPTSAIFTPIHHTPSSMLTTEERSSSPHIVRPFCHTKSSSPIKKWSLTAEGPLLNSDMSSSADQMQHISIQVLEEQLPSGEEKPFPRISMVTHGRQDPNSTEEPVLQAEKSLQSSSPPHKGFLPSDPVLHSEISMPPKQIQYISTSREEQRLPLYEVSSLTKSVPFGVKDEPLRAEEHFPHMPFTTHRALCTNLDVKEEDIWTAEPLPYQSISTSTYCTQSAHVKEEHSPPSVSAHTCVTNSPCMHVKEEPTAHEEKHALRCKLTQNTSAPITEDSNPCKKGCMKEPSSAQSGQHIPARLSHPAPRRVHTQRRFVCGECGRSYSIISNLAIHMKTHSGDQLYKCWECGETVGEVSLLAAHHQRHAAEREHVNAMSAEGQRCSRAPRGESLPEEQKCTCGECGEGFSSKSSLTVHTKLHTERKPYCCPGYSKGLNKRSARNKRCAHPTEVKPFSCSDCGRSFNRQSDLTRHRNHARQQHQRCSKCGKSFREKGSCAVVGGIQDYQGQDPTHETL